MLIVTKVRNFLKFVLINGDRKVAIVSFLSPRRNNTFFTNQNSRNQINVLQGSEMVKYFWDKRKTLFTVENQLQFLSAFTCLQKQNSSPNQSISTLIKV
jgi:hypothetical protein